MKEIFLNPSLLTDGNINLHHICELFFSSFAKGHLDILLIIESALKEFSHSFPSKLTISTFLIVPEETQ